MGGQAALAKLGARAVVGAGLLLSVVLAIGFTLEAIEERESANAATDMTMAATIVAHADQVQQLGGEVAIDMVSQSIAVLNGDRESALHSLSADEAAQAHRLLDDISSCGIALLELSDDAEVSHEHGEVQGLLRLATERSAVDAAEAERSALIALGAMLAVVLFFWWLVTKSRAQAVRQQAVATEQLRAAQRVEVLLNDLPDILLVVDADGSVTFRSSSASRILHPENTSIEDLIDRAAPGSKDEIRSRLINDGSSDSTTVFELSTQEGEFGFFTVRVSDLTEHALVEGLLVTIRDVTNEVELRNELRKQADTDALTGLPNRRVLQSTLDDAWAATDARGGTMALLTLDIDGFKEINDTLGHHAGDELLVAVATRLDAATTVNETLVRLGGDEFAVVIPDVADSATAESAALRLLDVLDEPFLIDSRSEHVRTSIGVAIGSDPDHTALLFREADIALYEAKRLGGDRVAVFEDALGSTASRRDQVNRALRDVVYDDEFRLEFQPIVTANTREISSLEALLRWTSPTLGIIGPNEFIPVAETTGDICALGKWVFEHVCEQLASWNAAGMDSSVAVSVNVSPRQLAEAQFVGYVVEAAQRWGVRPEQLIIEVTESAALDHSGAAGDQLEQLRAVGFRISIDDFGAGYSNLGQLLAVPFDVIKVDRSLLLRLSDMREQAGGDPADACAIMEAIVSIASTTGAPVVCEGVETEQQFASLRASGITHIQGYLTGRPTSPELLTPLLQEQAPSRTDRIPDSATRELHASVR